MDYGVAWHGTARHGTAGWQKTDDVNMERWNETDRSRKEMGLRHWQCRVSGDSNILYTKRQQSGKDSLIEGQPSLLFM
jgi:hypothetical protein